MLAQVCLKQMARDLCRFKKEWGKWNLDITEIANRPRQVPSQAACDVYQSIFLISTAIRESLMAMSVETMDVEPRTKST